MSTSELVWLITGTSSGLGRELALAALSRGDKVIATSRPRSKSQLNDLETRGAAIIDLDVTPPLKELHDTAQRAVEIYGRIDVLVNNAGYILLGTVEECTPEETLHEFNTNVFGGLNVTRAFLPYMRERKSGTIIWLGSLGGWRASPYAGLYCATKWTLRGVSYTLHEEIAPLGLRSTCLDFGYFRTSFLQDGHRAPAVSRIPDYQKTVDVAEKGLQAYNGRQPGDPVKGAQLIVDVLHGTGLAKDKPLPLALAIGSDSYQVCKAAAENQLKNLEEWKDVSLSTDFQ